MYVTLFIVGLLKLQFYDDSLMQKKKNIILIDVSKYIIKYKTFVNQ